MGRSYHLNWYGKRGEGQTALNTKLAGRTLDVAQQDIAFRLERKGAELESETKLYGLKCASLPLLLDGPFLVYMQKRGSEEPYFVMWVDDAEVLMEW